MTFNHNITVELLVRDLQIEEAAAETINKIIRCRLTMSEILKICPKTKEWKQSLYNNPGDDTIRLHAIDELLNTCGIEGLKHQNVEWEYCNAGDAYTCSIFYDITNGDFHLCCLADITEELEESEYEDEY